MSAGFGPHLREWRSRRGLSQLQLGTLAGVSQRHISFLETGRSSPSPEMVTHLAVTLDLPLRERNLLLGAAGLPPAHPETDLSEMEDVATVVEFVLSAHAPFMAVVVDRHWDVVSANDPARRFMGHLFPGGLPEWVGQRLNLMRLSLHPDGMRRHMTGWDRSASMLHRRLEREAAASPHDRVLRSLVSELGAHVPAVTGPPGPGDLLIPFRYVIDGDRIDLMTTIATIGEPHDVTLAELRIETFFPVDGASRTRWIERFGS